MSLDTINQAPAYRESGSSPPSTPEVVRPFSVKLRA